jgi:hypothetical protein
MRGILARSLAPGKEERGNDQEPQLDDLATDPAERANLATTRPEKVRELAALLESIRRASEPLAGAARVVVALVTKTCRQRRTFRPSAV